LIVPSCTRTMQVGTCLRICSSKESDRDYILVESPTTILDCKISSVEVSVLQELMTANEA
jgi:hypothetical protein